MARPSFAIGLSAHQNQCGGRGEGGLENRAAFRPFPGFSGSTWDQYSRTGPRRIHPDDNTPRAGPREIFIRTTTTTRAGRAPPYLSGQQHTESRPPPIPPDNKRREDFWPPFLRCFWLARTSGYRRRPVQQLLAAAQRGSENWNEPEGETGFTDGPEALSHPLPRAPWVCSRALVGLVGVGGLRVGII